MYRRQWMKSLLLGIVWLVALNAATQAQTWIELFPTGVPSFPIHAPLPVHYDQAHNRLIVFFPGNPAVGGPGNQVWVLTNANGLGGAPAWIKLLPTGTPPFSNSYNSAVYDATNNRLIVYGGCWANCSPALNNVFVLSNANGLGGPPVWTQSTVTNPQARVGHSSVYDAVNNLLLAFGGHFAFFGTDQNDTRTLSNANGIVSPSTWTTLAPVGGPPPIRDEHTAIYDQANNRMTVFAGHRLISTCCPYVISDYNDTWVLANANGSGGTPTWTQLSPAGTLPSVRSGHSAVYDSMNNRMLVFGGAVWNQTAQTGPPIGDLWQLSNANGQGGTPAWTQLLQLGSLPGPRFAHSAAFDVANQRMIVLGGRDVADLTSNRVWVLDFTPPSCTPPPSGMISWWTGDGTANDLIGSNHGTLQNDATFAPGVVGQAFSFDGADDYVQVANNPSLQLPDAPFAIAVWFKTPDLVRADGQVLLSKGISDDNEEYSILLTPDGAIYWDYGDGQAYVVTIAGVVMPNQWQHLVVLYNPLLNPRGRVYLNGLELGIAFSGSHQSHIVNSGGNFYIGTQNAGTPYYVNRVSFGGIIDEVTIFNRALATSEIQAIFNAGSAGKCKNQAPVALCQNVTVAAGANCTAAATINNGTYDPDGDAITVTQSPAGPYPLGNTLVTLTVTDSQGASSQCTATVTVVDNTAPAITLNGANPMTVECHTGFSDPGATALDNCAGTVVVTTSGSVNPNVPGSYTLTYAATDGTNSASTTRTVNVVDTTAPGFTLKSSLTLWPPNHKYTTVSTAQMVQSVSDSCATLSLSQVVLEQVTSDEPDNGLGDGDTANDIVLASDCKAVQLRAERAGGGNGRVYSVRLRVQDGHGNSTSQEFKVTVPLNQNGAPAVEDAPVSTKTCGGGSAVLTPGGTLKPAVTGDFDGDRQTDFAVWRGQQGAWLVQASTAARLDLPLWGASYAPYHDVLALGDYDGDGKADQAIYRRSNGTFYVKGSTNGAVSAWALGSGQDEPVPGDYDGDGRTDFAVWQAASGTWLLQRSGGQRLALQWGSGVAPYFDVPVPADFDGDGQTDLAVYRRSTGTWYIRRSSDSGVVIQAWGLATDVPVPGDYDGDGKTDLAVWRGSEGNWYVRRSSDGKYQITAWGAERVGDVPVPGDYDGDGKTDWAVWRVPAGTWYIWQSSDRATRQQRHGQSGDVPMCARKLP